MKNWKKTKRQRRMKKFQQHKLFKVTLTGITSEVKMRLRLAAEALNMDISEFTRHAIKEHIGKGITDDIVILDSIDKLL